MSQETRDLNDEHLRELLARRSGYAAVSFLCWSSIPCDHFRPELKTLARDLQGILTFYRLDVEENPKVTDELGVTAVPTTLLFKDGVEVKRWEGPYTHEALASRIAEEMKRPG